MKTTRGLLAFLIGIFLGGYATFSHAGYFYESYCYKTTADALLAVQASYPRFNATRTYYLTASTISATGLLSMTVASKLPTAATVTAGVANTYQLATCLTKVTESAQWYADQNWLAISAVQAAVQSLDVTDNQVLAKQTELTNIVSQVAAAQGMTNARQYSLESLIIAVLGVALFFIGFNSGKGRH